jgi:Holliday junction resolvasome RuvABC endonuclease subunit
MIIMGLDVSLVQTGIARWQELPSGAQHLETFRVPSPDLGDSLLAMRRRIRVTVDRVMLRMPKSFDLLVVERPLPARSGFASLQLERAAAYWMLIDQLLPRGPVVDVHPKTRAKIATGNGNAKKRDVLLQARRDFHPLQLADDNAADAVVLMAAGCARFGRPLIEYTAEQRKGLAAIEWPGDLAADGLLRTTEGAGA